MLGAFLNWNDNCVPEKISEHLSIPEKFSGHLSIPEKFSETQQIPIIPNFTTYAIPVILLSLTFHNNAFHKLFILLANLQNLTNLKILG